MNYNMPDQKGYFGKHGGRFVPETLMPALLALEKISEPVWKTKTF